MQPDQPNTFNPISNPTAPQTPSVSPPAPSSASPAEPSVSPLPSSPVGSTPSSDGVSPQSPKSKKLLLIIGSIIAALVIGGGAAAFFVLKKDKTPDTTQNQSTSEETKDNEPATQTPADPRMASLTITEWANTGGFTAIKYDNSKADLIHKSAAGVTPLTIYLTSRDLERNFAGQCDLTGDLSLTSVGRLSRGKPTDQLVPGTTFQQYMTANPNRSHQYSGGNIDAFVPNTKACSTDARATAMISDAVAAIDSMYQ